MAERLDETTLKALLSSEIRAADTFYRSELSTTRARNMEYYRGEMKDTPAMAGRSSVVSRDVADVIGWLLPGIIRVFTASERIAEYDPVGPEDEEGAKQATDYCNYVFMKDNPGYRILWDGTHDSLLMGNGIIKHYWDDAEECEYAEHTGMTAEQIALLLEDRYTEVTAQEEGEPQMVPMMGPDGQMVEQSVQTFNIKTKRVTMAGRIRVECIEPENFLIDKWATCIEDARFTAHRDDVTRSDLVEMGFNKDIVDQLSPWRDSATTEESIARDDQSFDNSANIGDESQIRVELYECYIRVDVDGDGISETVRAYYAGAGGAGDLLDWEVWDDDVPFSDIPCEPVPHRWDARSVADETTDMQRVKTVLLRQMLDNLYASAIPMQEAEVGSIVNPEMLTSPKFGGVVWRKKGSLPVVPHTIPFVADKVLSGLEYIDQVIERRTGVSRATMALDPQTLQNQTATANQNQRDAAYSQIELIARNQAELGWKRVFRQILRLIVKHQDRPRTIRLRNEWVEVDPRYWNANMDATINVGLGTGSRDRDMAMLNNIMANQVGMATEFKNSGFADQAIDMTAKITKTAIKIAESAGLKNPDDFYPVFDEQALNQMKQQAAEMANKPDPKTQIEQQKLEAKVAEGQANIQMDQQKMQAQMAADQHKMEMDMAADQQKAAADLQLQREKMVMEGQLKREQIAAELQLKREQLIAEIAMKRELAMEEMAIKRDVGFYTADAKAATSGVHVGGEPG